MDLILIRLKWMQQLTYYRSIKRYFRYRIEDPQGGKNYNAQGSSTSTDPDLNSIGELIITINGVDDVNDAPVTTADTGQVYENFT